MSKLLRSSAAWCVIFGLLNLPAAALAASEFSGTAVMTAIPVTALATAYLKDDREGEKQWLRNLLANQLLNSAARLGFNYTSLGKRPDGSGYGFPSGHVAFAGSGAALLEERYGWEYGVPAWLATGYVAYVRVDNKDHHWRDVVAASALSYGVGKLFVTPENAVHLAPVLGPDMLGFRLGRSW
jgi:membrane-associated phospholipid phosphatase